ncbi:MAG TPA: conjugal transfer protein TrbE [Oligoflexia bacterium]|nr:conjugal transfer protein TrbE [Oligoflexia bacterium]HMP49136.1 conjugal transfer protein TrbE [Oligoflexia bacterium]
MINFREYRNNPDRLSDLLPWAALIQSSVILNKDGSFLSVLRFRGPDLDSSTEEELLVKSAQINNVLKRLGSGWALFSEGKRSVVNTYPESSFPNPVAALIDAKRRQLFLSDNHFESSYYLSFVFLPQEENTSKLASRFINNEETEAVNYKFSLQLFTEEIDRIYDLFERMFPEVEILKDDSLLTYLHQTISTKDHVIRLPETPMYLDAILADSPLLGGFHPKLGDHYLSVIGILGFPGFSQPGLLDQLNRIPIEYRWSTRFIFLDKSAAKHDLEQLQRKWFAKRKSIGTLIKELLTKEESILSDSDALQKAEDAQAALMEAGTDEISYGYFTTSLVCMHEDRETLKNLTSQIERVINGVGFVTRRETVNAVDAWLGTIPGNTRNNVRRPLLNTMNLAHLIPGASAVWGGQEENRHLDAPPLLIAETGGSTPFRLVHHIGDVGHTLILGPTGSGKSTLLNLLEVQFTRYKDAQVYIFDKGGSALTLTAAMGGDFYDLGAEDSELYFQPLACVDEEEDKKWAHEWLCAIAESERVIISPEVKRSIWDALTALGSTPKAQRTLHTLTVYLQNVELRAAFEPYTQKGAYGKLLDNSHDNLSISSWQCFEMERLMETPAILAPVLSYLFHRLESRFDGSPTLLVLDEAWLFLDHPAFSSKIREWLKTLRKLNVSVIFATQSLADVDNSPIAPTIKEACFTKIYLPNSIALQPDVSEFYRSFGLNKRQIEILAFSVPKKDYYYTSPLGNRLFDLGLDPLTLAFCAGVSAEQRNLVRELTTTLKDPLSFSIEYLKRKGLLEDARDLTRLNTYSVAA